MPQLTNAELIRLQPETPLYRVGVGIVQRLKILEVIHDSHDGAGIDFSGVGLLWGSECDGIFLDKNEAYCVAAKLQVSSRLARLKKAQEILAEALRNIALPLSIDFDDLTGDKNE